MTNASTAPQRRFKVRSSLVVRLLIFGVPVLIVAVLLGRHLGQDWLEFKQWITQLGYWGPFVLMLMLAILSVFLFPDSPFAMAGGALFGMAWGGAAAVAGVMLGATLTFWVSRLLLRARVRRYLDEHPRWSAVESAASREGVRLQLLIRLTPIHSALFSYVMGASHVTYTAFAVGTLAMIPGLLVEVYCGHVAGHVAGLASGTSPHSMTHTLATVFGLLMAVVVMAYVARLAGRAIAESEAGTERAPGSHGP